MKKICLRYIAAVWCLVTASGICRGADIPHIDLTLIPPGRVTDKIDLDIRAGIVNSSTDSIEYKVGIYLNGESAENLLSFDRITLPGGETRELRFTLPTAGLNGDNRMILSVTRPDGLIRTEKKFTVMPSDIRSTRLIDGAWIGLYHWSEEEGKHWNEDIRQMTCDQWREMVRSMHEIGMDAIVLQELFRNQAYVGAHDITVENYSGKAFYPSKLYPNRMDIICDDPVEAILSECDSLGMTVMIGVGMFAWFDFTPESLDWHKAVARELWDMYGHHPSFYAFYISEECAGNLYNNETTPLMQLRRHKEIADFFREFKKYTATFAPGKPVMLATNSMEVLKGANAYPAMLQNLDILCPFGFARMPQGDLTGKEAADTLQRWCDEAGAHLWFDLEAFLFNPDSSLYPRPIEEIIDDLNSLDNFEKVFCYQFPGVFNHPEASRRVGEKRTVDLYIAYRNYYHWVTSRQRDNASNTPDLYIPIKR